MSGSARARGNHTGAPALRPDGHRHKRSLGQNFLTDPALLCALADDAGVGAADHVLEVGAGAGDMTRVLAARCKSVTAVELDATLLPFLRLALENHANARVVHGDILRVNLPEIMRDVPAFHIVANIPYYLTTELLTRLFSGKLPILSISVMLQQEAAGRVLARPSTPAYGMLAVRAQYYADPRVARIVEAARFTPPPRVDSAFVVMPMRPPPAVPVRDERLFFRVAAAAFAQRRKTMCNNLCPAFRLTRAQALAWLARAGLPADVRGEALSLAQFATLADTAELD